MNEEHGIVSRVRRTVALSTDGGRTNAERDRWTGVGTTALVLVTVAALVLAPVTPALAVGVAGASPAETTGAGDFGAVTGADGAGAGEPWQVAGADRARDRVASSDRSGSGAASGDRSGNVGTSVEGSAVTNAGVEASTHVVKRRHSNGTVYQTGRVTSGPQDISPGDTVTVTGSVEHLTPPASDNVVYAVLGTADGTILSVDQMSRTGSGTVTSTATIPTDAAGKQLAWTFYAVLTASNAESGYKNDASKPSFPDNEKGVPLAVVSGGSVSAPVERAFTNGTVYQTGQVTDAPETVTAGESVRVTGEVSAVHPAAEDELVYAVLGLPNGTVVGTALLNNPGSGTVTVEATAPSITEETPLVWTFFDVLSDGQARAEYRSLASDDALRSDSNGVTATTVTPGETTGGGDLRSISYGETKSGYVDEEDPRDETYLDGFRYEPVTFTGSAGDNVTVDATPDGDRIPAVRLRDSSGTVVATGSLTDYVLASDGEYTIEVGFLGTGEGSYSLSLSRVGTAPPPDNRAPTALFSTDPRTGDAGEPVTLNASPSRDPDGSITAYEWDVDGDGAVDATGRTIEHTFDEAGEYAVTLAVTDDAGVTANTTLPITVTESGAGAGQAPDVTVDVTPTTPTPGQTVTFDASGSTDPDADRPTFLDREGENRPDNLDYAWDFDGDGETDETGERATTAFRETETHEVTVTVTDDEGQTTTETVTVEVLGGSELPVADFDITPLSVSGSFGEGLWFGRDDGTFNLTLNRAVVELVDRSSARGDGEIVDREWEVAGERLAGERPTFTFDEPGRHVVQLTVTDSTGRTNATTQVVEVTRPDTEPTIASVDREIDAAVPVDLSATIEDTFSATVVTGTGDPVDRVTFDLAGETRTASAGEDSTYEATYDLTELDDDATLTVTAYDVDGDTATETVAVPAVTLPNWFPSLSDLVSTPTRVRAEFNKSVGPVDHTVDVPNRVPVIGGKPQGVEANAELGIVFNHVVETSDTTLSMGARGAVSGNYLNRGVEGDLRLDFTIGPHTEAGETTWRIREAHIRAGLAAELFSQEWGVPGVPHLSPTVAVTVEAEGNADVNFTNDGGGLDFYYGSLKPGVSANATLGNDVLGVEGSGFLRGFLETVGFESWGVGLESQLSATGWACDPFVKSLCTDFTVYVPSSPATVELGWAPTAAAPVVEHGDTTYRVGPGTRPSGDLAGTAGAGTEVARLTDDAVADTGVDLVADRDWNRDRPRDRYTAVWSRGSDGRHVVAATLAPNGTATERTRVSGDGLAAVDPVVAVDDGRARAVWTSYEPPADGADVNVAALYEGVELATATRTDDGWSDPRPLTDNAVADAQPAVARAGGASLVAWRRDADTDPETTGDRHVRYAVVGVGEGPVESHSLADGNATRVAVAPAPAEEDAFALAYFVPDAPNADDGTLVAATVDADGTVDVRDRYEVTNLTALSLTGTGLAWVDRSLTEPRASYVPAGSGDRQRVPLGNISAVRDLSVAETDGRPVLAVRGRAAGVATPSVFYLQRSGDTDASGEGAWVSPTPVFGGENASLTVTRPAIAGTESGFLTVAPGRNVSAGRSQRADLFTASHAYRPNLRTAATATLGSDGETVTVEYSVTNRGDSPVEGGTVVAFAAEGAVRDSRSVGELAVGESATGAFETALPRDGAVVVRADPGGAVDELTTDDNAARVTAVRPDLTVQPVDATRTDGNVTVEAVLENDAPVAAGDVTVALELGNETVTTTVPGVGPDATRGVSLQAPADAAAGVTRARVVADPDDTVAESGERNNEAVTGLLRPDLSVEDRAITFVRDDAGVRALIPVVNAGVGPATALTNVSVGEWAEPFRLPVGAAGDTETRVSRLVAVRLPDGAANETLTVRADPARSVDLRPADNLAGATVTDAVPVGESRLGDGLAVAAVDAPDEVTTGEAFDVTVTVENPGDVPAAAPVTLSLGGTEDAVTTPLVPAGETKTVTFADHTLAEGGTADYRLSVGNTSATGTLTVESSDEEQDGNGTDPGDTTPEDQDPDDTTPEDEDPDESETPTDTPADSSETGTPTPTPAGDDSPGATVETPGTTDAPTGTADASDDSSGSGPGLGVGASLVALLAAALLLARRRDG